MLAVELVGHAARQHRLGKKKTDLLTYKSILNHMNYQLLVECFKDNKVSSRKGAYAEELANIKEALVQFAHSDPSAEEMSVRSGDAAVHDAWPSGTVRQLNASVQGCVCVVCLFILHDVQGHSHQQPLTPTTACSTSRIVLISCRE